MSLILVMAVIFIVSAWLQSNWNPKRRVLRAIKFGLWPAILLLSTNGAAFIMRSGMGFQRRGDSFEDFLMGWLGASILLGLCFAGGWMLWDEMRITHFSKRK
jgi:hypothetical protein